MLAILTAWCSCTAPRMPDKKFTPVVWGWYQWQWKAETKGRHPVFTYVCCTIVVVDDGGSFSATTIWLSPLSNMCVCTYSQRTARSDHKCEVKTKHQNSVEPPCEIFLDIPWVIECLNDSMTLPNWHCDASWHLTLTCKTVMQFVTLYGVQIAIDENLIVIKAFV